VAVATEALVAMPQATMVAQAEMVEVVAVEPTTLAQEALVAQELFIFTTKGNL
jgi:hypothetical protein